MTRPYYETDEDLSLEKQEAIFIENMTGQNLYKVSIKYGCDYIGIKMNIITSMYEIKCRPTISRTTYNSYMISLWKFYAGMSFAKAMNIQYIIHVLWGNPEERGEVVCIGEMLSNINMQKVNFRDDKRDIEPCVYIPIDQFTLL